MNRRIAAAFLVVLMLFRSVAWAGECMLVGSTCVDNTSSKNISGVTVTLADVGGCWEYEDVYNCLKPESIDYCQAISKTTGCWQTSTTCSKVAFNGECMVDTRVYRCGDASLPAPANTVKLDFSYSIVNDSIDRSQCATYEQNNRCTIAAHTCVAGPETRVINGLPVYKDCWEWRDDYTCLSIDMQSNCQPLINKGCRLMESNCIDTDPVLGCMAKEEVYDCITKKGETHTVKDCSAKVACSGGVCWDSGSPADTDLARVVATQEAAREAAAYADQYGSNLFRGNEEKCREGWGGLKKCCDSSGGAKTNNSVMSQLGLQAATYGIGEAANVGSKFVFDFMYPDGGFIDSGMQCISSAAFTPTNFNPGIGMYGITYGGQFGALAAGETATGMFGQTVYGMGGGFAIDPTTLVISIVIMIITELMSCEEEEMMLSMHKGSGLCHYVGSYCSTKFLGACLETTESYCCFNSKLAKIIQEQGRPQIGKGWGSAKNPNCEGFSTSEFQKIDFSKIDMTEFVADITKAINLPTQSQIDTTAAAIADKLAQ